MPDLIAPASLANFLLVTCRESGEVLTNLKLQKLMYYSQAWHLALRDIPLFNEDFQAWVHGPVLPLNDPLILDEAEGLGEEAVLVE